MKLRPALAPPYISAKESFSTNVSLHGDKLIIFFWKRMYIYLYHHREAKSDGCTQVKLIVWNFYAPEPHNTEWAAMSVWASVRSDCGTSREPDRSRSTCNWAGMAWERPGARAFSQVATSVTVQLSSSRRLVEVWNTHAAARGLAVRRRFVANFALFVKNSKRRARFVGICFHLLTTNPIQTK